MFLLILYLILGGVNSMFKKNVTIVDILRQNYRRKFSLSKCRELFYNVALPLCIGKIRL